MITCDSEKRKAAGSSSLTPITLRFCLFLCLSAVANSVDVISRNRGDVTPCDDVTQGVCPPPVDADGVFAPTNHRQRRSATRDEPLDVDKLLKKMRRQEKNSKRQKRTFEKRTAELSSRLLELQNRIDALEQHTTPRAHFAASPDVTLLSQVRTGHDTQTVEGIYTANGLLPADSTYRFWNVSDDTDSLAFQYHRDTGKVFISEGGTYLIYAQVMFHDSSDRCGYSIFINATDVARCVAFGTTPPTGTSPHGHVRHQRPVPPGTPAPGVVSHLNYRQCSTQTIRYVPGGSSVYLKGLYQNRTLVATPTLTFWQIARLD